MNDTAKTLDRDGSIDLDKEATIEFVADCMKAYVIETKEEEDAIEMLVEYNYEISKVKRSTAKKFCITACAMAPTGMTVVEIPEGTEAR